MKRQRKKYLRPSHPWEKERMNAEDKTRTQYGLSRKVEIWRAQTLLRNFRGQARNLLAASGKQAEVEAKQLLTRLRGLGLVGEEASLDDVLGLTIDKLLERRLQTIVGRKGLARTMLQARQLVTHGHIAIAGRRVNVPSYLVTIKEEASVGYSGKSILDAKSAASPTPPPEAAAIEEPESSSSGIEADKEKAEE